ncbi:S8 family peptidase [Bacillus infantis]|uniref:S8 family peptidase n=1 Tax=Bacillus infantis TaxID=324767 RepID=UPI0021551C2D|nr:S8 family serine peptidase [Bacillus infantis]MCR6612965.1 S8 family serine peptidase [Bacillus infantis]
MKKILTALSLVLFFLILPHPAQGEEQRERVIVNFKEDIDSQVVHEYATEIHHTFNEMSAVSISIDKSDYGKLAGEPSVLKVEEDEVVKTNAQITDWGYTRVNAGASKSNGWTGKGVKIGIIDSGIRKDHPDLRVAGGVNFVEGASSYNDDQGHGTHVAGIAAALDNDIGSVGVAPDAELYAIKVIAQTGEGNLSDIVAGISWAIQQKLDIINMSVTAPEGSYLLNETLTKAYNSGMLIFAASGNAINGAPANADVLFPARYPSVIAVGSVNQNNERSAFSYYGNSLEFTAPGEKVWSTYIAAKDYAYLTGTSMATPYTAGIAALYKQAYPEMTNIQIRTLMQASAIDLGMKGKDAEYGYGLVQAPEAKEEPPASSAFPDISNSDWYAKEIDYLYKKEIITGYNNGNFEPRQPVSRAEAVTMIGKALGLPGDKTESGFYDVSAASFASGYIREAAKQSIIKGFPDGSFRPEGSIIRGDVAVMLQRAFSYPMAERNIFTDVQAGKYYAGPINALTSAGIATGFPDGTFRPFAGVTRGEFAVFLARVLDDSFIQG